MAIEDEEKDDAEVLCGDVRRENQADESVHGHLHPKGKQLH